MTWLAIRMVLYASFAMLAGQGLGFWDQEAGTFTIHVESLVELIAGAAGYIATFAMSRKAVVK